MQIWNQVRSGASLLDQRFVQPVAKLTSSAVHEVTETTHNLVHAVEQPIQNIVNDSKQVVGGLYTLAQGAMNFAPYWVGAWLAWTAFEMYFPGEKRALDNTLGRAYKRMRLT